MEQIEARIEDLRQGAADRETMRYPEAFKEDATAVVRHLRADGFTQSANCWRFPGRSLARWKDSGEESNDGAESSAFRPVKVVDGDPPGANSVSVSPSS